MAPGPQACAAIFRRERHKRPHNIHEIFDAALGAGPHVLIAMRHLRQCARMDLDRLGEIERDPFAPWQRSEEHTSELQSLMRISYAVFCLKKKNTKTTKH